MATTTQTPIKTADPAKKLPPDERFWQRYSPHHEFSLSSVGSVAIHALIIGLLVLIGYLITWAGLNQPPPKLPNEAVVLSGGGGGGTANGVKDTKGKPQKEAQPRERPTDDSKQTKPQDVPPPPTDLDLTKIAQSAPTKITESKNFNEYLVAAKTNKSKAAFWKEMLERSENDLMSGVAPPAGPKDGGPGKDGGTGGGKDGGEGTGVGPGKGEGTMNSRQKRMLRWVMSFNTARGQSSYFEQLKGLGAVIAIPTPKSATHPAGYKPIFWPSGVKHVENIAELNRIYWKDYDPSSVRQVMIGAKYAGGSVEHFVALMPAELEEKLSQMEKQRAERAGHTVDDVFETKFEVRQTGFRFEPVLLEQTYK